MTRSTLERWSEGGSKKMSLREGVSFLSVLLLSIALLPNVYAASADTKLPFYFPVGVIQTSDPIKQMQEYARYLTATSYKFQGIKGRTRRLIPGSDSIVIQTDIDSTTAVVSEGKPLKCKIVLDHFVRMPDGKIRVTQLSDQFFITEEELKIVSDDLIAVVKAASQADYEFYKDLSEVAFKARAMKILSPTNNPTSSVASIIATQMVAMKAMLDDKDPIYKEVTLRDLHYLPKQIKPSDFVPKELHLGYNPKIEGILGVCWLNSGIIYYNPQARILDYLTGKPKVLQHEMVHCNYNLEKFPLASGFDAEMFAMFPGVLIEEDQIDLFFHHYCEDLRELCYIYFGFDFDKARKEIFKYDLAGSVIIDEVKYKEYFKKVDEIRRELAYVVRNYIIPEFYSESLWWSSMHDKLRDKNGLFWVMMAKHYRPAIIGSARETSVWLSAHHEEIMEIAKKAYLESGSDRVGIFVGGRRISYSLLSEMARFLDPEDRAKVVQYFEDNPKAIKKLSRMSINQAINFIKSISQKRLEVMDLEK